MVSIYDLNPVAVNAQSSVPIPEGLDLDAWIVPPKQEPEADQGTVERKVKKTKKGKEKAKGKDADGAKGKSGRNKQEDVDARQKQESRVTLAPSEEETPEEKAQRVKVCSIEHVSVRPYLTIIPPSARQSVWHNFETTHTTSSTTGRQFLQPKTLTQYP